jgi:hypothetical protein
MKWKMARNQSHLLYYDDLGGFSIYGCVWSAIPLSRSVIEHHTVVALYAPSG